MKNQFKGFITGMLVTLFLVGSIGTAAATVGTQTAQLSYNNIKVTLDGENVNLVDVNGDPVEPFIIDGTTYLPIRAISNAFGLDVGWDAATQTVILTHPDAAQPSQSQASNPGSGSTANENNSSESSSSESSSSGNNSGGNGNADNFYTWDNPDQQNTSAQWVLNTSSLKIHYPTCSEVRKIAPQNYSTSNLSEAELLSQGYTTCGRCH